jgi:hypothetical protein
MPNLCTLTLDGVEMQPIDLESIIEGLEKLAGSDRIDPPSQSLLEFS